MSSCSLSAVEFLLRMAVAMPVSVATFPIGSSASAGGGAVAGGGGEGGAGRGRGPVGGGHFVGGPDTSSTGTDFCTISSGDGIANRLAAPVSMKPPASQSANENRRRVKT